MPLKEMNGHLPKSLGAKKPPISGAITIPSGSEEDTTSPLRVKQEPPSSDEDLFTNSSSPEEKQYRQDSDLFQLTEGLTAQDFESDF